MGFQIATTDERGDVDLDGLSPGDGVMFSVTHEVTVDGEKSWVKYGATTSVRTGETPQEAFNRLSANVNRGALLGVEQAVKAVRGYVPSAEIERGKPF